MKKRRATRFLPDAIDVTARGVPDDGAVGAATARLRSASRPSPVNLTAARKMTLAPEFAARALARERAARRGTAFSPRNRERAGSDAAPGDRGSARPSYLEKLTGLFRIRLLKPRRYRAPERASGLRKGCCDVSGRPGPDWEGPASLQSLRLLLLPRAFDASGEPFLLRARDLQLKRVQAHGNGESGGLNNSIEKMLGPDDSNL